MAFKIDPARLGTAATARLQSISKLAISKLAIPKHLLKSPAVRGVVIAVAVAAVLAAWVAIKSEETLAGLRLQTPSVKAEFSFEAPKKDEPKEKVAEKPPEPAVPGTLPGLIEQTPIGALPKIGPDGTPPWRAYARPAVATTGPRIAILVVGLGLQAATDERAIKTLPAEISLAFLAYADRAAQLMADARGAGHEILINAPMEPDNYPADDPGPRALLVKATAEENISRLSWDMARAVGYVGVAPALGARFTASPEPLQPILSELARRGLLYVDTGTAVFSAAPALARTIGVPIAIADRTIDKVPSKAAIEKELSELEATAKSKGMALGIVSPTPAALERLASWSTTLAAKGIVLVPVSAVTQAPAPSTATPSIPAAPKRAE